EVPAADYAEHMPGAQVGQYATHHIGDCGTVYRPTRRTGRLLRGRHPRAPSGSITASTRAGLPVPPTIGNGVTTSIAPTAGNRPRLRSEVMPYLSLPRK